MNNFAQRIADLATAIDQNTTIEKMGNGMLRAIIPIGDAHHVVVNSHDEFPDHGLDVTVFTKIDGRFRRIANFLGVADALLPMMVTAVVQHSTGQEAVTS